MGHNTLTKNKISYENSKKRNKAVLVDNKEHQNIQECSTNIIFDSAR